MAHITERTSSLNDLDLKGLISDPNLKSIKKKNIDVHAVSSAFGLMLYTHAEYLPRTSRNDLLRRALAADVISVASIDNTETKREMHFKSSLLIREFMRRFLVHSGPIEYVSISFHCVSSEEHSADAPCLSS